MTDQTNKKQLVIVERAAFNPDVRKYWLLSGTLILFITVAGIPLIPIWYLIGMWATGRYLDRMECILTEKTLIVRKGLFIREEKTVPLDKITDLGMVQGPVMRFFNIHAVTVETAGQSGPGSLIKLHGIVDPDGFRDLVLEQRDRLHSSVKQGREDSERSETALAANKDSGDAAESVLLLREIRDLLAQSAEKP